MRNYNLKDAVLYRDSIVLVLFFIVSRIGSRLLGLTFDCSTLDWFYQFIDPLLLKTRLWESLVYLHAQPPLFNLFLGIILKISNGLAPSVFAIVYACTGLILILALYMLLRVLSIPRFLALGLCAFFTITPPVILYENWLFYTYPVTMLLVLSALFLYEFLAEHKSIYLILFFTLIAMIVLTRTLFHTLWFIAIIVWLLLSQRKYIRKIILSAIIPLSLVGCIHLKNIVLFGQSTLSSWFGMNIAKMTLSVSTSTLKKHITQDGLSSIAYLEPFGPPTDYTDYAHFEPLDNIPVLDQTYKSTGYPNYNHRAYISISHQYLNVARFLIQHHPESYLLSVLKAVYAYLRPCSDRTIFVNDNRAKINAWVSIYEYVFLGDFLGEIWSTTFTNRFGQVRQVHINFLYIYIPCVIITGILLLQSRLWRDKAQKNVYIYILFTILYVTIIGNCLEMSENMRFRFLIVPFIYVVIGILFKYFIKKTHKT